MTLALAAHRTERIGLGPGVLVPSLRHPMTNAAATLADLAPGRVAVAFGAGFTGSRAMGYGAITWSYMDSYIRAYRGLLRGEIVAWEGKQMQMLHPAGHAPARPVDVPVLVGALGPKGNKVATELDEDEAPSSDHAPCRWWPGLGVGLSRRIRVRRPRRRTELPGGAAWLAVVNQTPADQRHLAVHEGHCVELNEADQAAWHAGGYSVLHDVASSGTPDQVRRKLDDIAARGVTEIVFQPCGPNIQAELERYLDAAGA